MGGGKEEGEGGRGTRGEGRRREKEDRAVRVSSEGAGQGCSTRAANSPTSQLTGRRAAGGYTVILLIFRHWGSGGAVERSSN